MNARWKEFFEYEQQLIDEASEYLNSEIDKLRQFARSLRYEFVSSASSEADDSEDTASLNDDVIIDIDEYDKKSKTQSSSAGNKAEKTKKIETSGTKVRKRSERTRKACLNCRKAKRKCSNTRPCDRCKKMNLLCVV